MAALISRVRLLINDPAGASQQFADQDIQDVLDEAREDVRYVALAPAPTYSGSTISYLDYYADLGSWEDDIVLKQYRIITVTPSASENIVGHWTFAVTTLPPVFAVGKLYDVYRGAADLLERLSARYMLKYNVVADGQNLQRSQMAMAIQQLARTYRMQQRARTIQVTRSDLEASASQRGSLLQPVEIDYM